MIDLVGWLREQLDADETAARACHYAEWHVPQHEAMVTPVHPEGNDYIAVGPWGCGMEDADAAHIAEWDPARVLADVAAKRAILELHQGDHECSAYDHNGEIDTCTWVTDGDCSTMRLLAQPYADRPGFDPAWRLDA